MTVLKRQPASLSGSWCDQSEKLHLSPPRLQMASLVQVHHSWRTFTLSVPLQHSIWLLRRLRPLPRPLAFSRPDCSGYAVRVFPSSVASDCLTRSCLLYAGRSGDITRRTGDRRVHRRAILAQVYQPLTPVRVHGASTQVPIRQHRSPGWSVSRVWFAGAELLSVGFRPQWMPSTDAGHVARISMPKDGSNGAFTRAVKGRAPENPKVSSADLGPTRQSSPSPPRARTAASTLSPSKPHKTRPDDHGHNSARD